MTPHGSIEPEPTPTPTVPAAEGETITLGEARERAIAALTRAEEARIASATVGDHWCDDGWHVVEPDSRRCICGLVGVTAPDLKAVADALIPVMERFKSYIESGVLVLAEELSIEQKQQVGSESMECVHLLTAALDDLRSAEVG